MTNNKINTAARLYRTPALLNASLHAFFKVVFVMVVQSVTLSKFESNVMAMNTPTTIIAMLIIELKSTIVLSEY